MVEICLKRLSLHCPSEVLGLAFWVGRMLKAADPGCLWIGHTLIGALLTRLPSVLHDLHADISQVFQGTLVISLDRPVQGRYLVFLEPSNVSVQAELLYP